MKLASPEPNRCTRCGKWRRPDALIWIDYQYVCPDACHEAAKADLTADMEAARLRRLRVTEEKQETHGG